MSKSSSQARAAAALRNVALAYPQVREDHPWGHSAFKVKGKTFLFLFHEQDFLSLSVKLPESGKAALRLPFASPTEYGLGRSGWVTAKFKGQDEAPLEMLEEWIAESFQAIAPQRVLDGTAAKGVGGKSPSRAPAKRKRKKK